MVGPAHRLGQWQRVEVSEGPAPAWLSSDSFTQHHKSSTKKVGYTTITQYHYQSHLAASIKYIAKCTGGSASTSSAAGTATGRAHVPPEVIRPRIGRHEDCRERQPCQCRHGYGPYASAHRVCHGSREAPSARPAPLASVLLFLDTGCQGGLKRISRERVRPLRGRSAHVALAVSEGQTTLRGCGGRGAAWPLTASEGQGLDPLETG